MRRIRRDELEGRRLANAEHGRARSAHHRHDAPERPQRGDMLRDLGMPPRHDALEVILGERREAVPRRERFGVEDADVLNAVRYHTTGRAGMSDVEKVVFLADKTEPDELAHYPEWREVRDLAQDDLDAAMLRALELYVEQARREGWTVHPDVVAAQEYLVERTRRSG